MNTELGVPLSPDVDLDEFLQSLKKVVDPAAPQQQPGSDMKSSHLTNTHQGDAANRAGSSSLASSGTVHVQAAGSQPAAQGTQPQGMAAAVGLSGQEIAQDVTAVATVSALGADAGVAQGSASPTARFEPVDTHVVGTQVQVTTGLSLRLSGRRGCSGCPGGRGRRSRQSQRGGSGPGCRAGQRSGQRCRGPERSAGRYHGRGRLGAGECGGRNGGRHLGGGRPERGLIPSATR